MSEEEKKAIEYLKNNHIPVLRYDNYGNILEPLYYGIEEKETLLNLIDKLQKERDIYYYECKTLEADLINNDIIPKDKIRKLLEKLNLKLDKLKQEMDKEYDMYGKSSVYLDLDEQLDYLYEIKELLEEK